MYANKSNLKSIYTILTGGLRKYIKTYSWNMGDPKGLHPATRALFIMTNFPFFIPLLTCVKWDSPSISAFLIGLLSSAYHAHQCACWEGINRVHTAKLKWVDILLTTPLGFYIVWKNLGKINQKIVFISLISLICYLAGIKKRTLKGQYNYMILHGIWHLLNGYVFYYLTVKKEN